MNIDVYLSGIERALIDLGNYCSDIGAISDEISKLAEDIRDLEKSIDYLTDKIGETK